MPPLRSHLFRPLLVSGCGLVSLLHAADGEDRVTITAGPYNSGIGSTGQVLQGTVYDDELALLPLHRPGSLLEVVPGMVATQHSGGGKANQYLFRGFYLDHGTDFAFSVDGMPANYRSHGHGQGYADLNFVIPEMVAAVSYQAGPYAVDVGDFGSAGSASLTLKETLEHDRINATIGSFGYARAMAAHDLELGSGTLLIAAEASRYDGPWTVEDDHQRRNGLVQWSRNHSNGGLRITALAYDADWTATDQIPLRLVESGLIDRDDSIDPTTGGETSRFSLSANWWWQEDANEVDITVYILGYELSLWSNFTYYLDSPATGDQFHQRDQRVSFGSHVRWRHTSEDLGEETTTTLGLQLHADRIGDLGLSLTENRDLRPPSGGLFTSNSGPVPRHTISFEPGATETIVRDDEVDQWSLAAYFEARTRWNANLDSFIGLRADLLKVDVSSDYDVNSGTADDIIISPKAGLVWHPAGHTDVYLSAGLGYHSNDARGATSERSPQTGLPVDAVDLLVASRGIDLGLRSAVIPTLEMAVGAWYLELDSEVVFVGDAGDTDDNGATDRLGMDLQLLYRPETLSWLQVDGNLSVLQARFSDEPSGDDHIPGALEQTFTGGVTATFESGWFGSLRVRHFGPYPLTEDGQIEADGSTMLNLAAGYRSDRLSIKGEVLNALDADDNDIEYYYTSRMFYEFNPRDDIHFKPVEPFQVRLTVEWRY